VRRGSGGGVRGGWRGTWILRLLLCLRAFLDSDFSLDFGKSCNTGYCADEVLLKTRLEDIRGKIKSLLSVG
jgi:hypothetical protein